MGIQPISNFTVLITDDDFVCRAVLKHILKKIPCKIEVAENGLEAITYLDNNPNERILLLLDINMPVMDGFQVIEHVTGRNGVYDNVKIIAITALNMSDLIERNVLEKIFAFQRKPVNQEDLLESIQAALIV